MGIKKYNLLVVAHPDDESIFFAGLILSKQKIPWKLICMTDANADGNGLKRMDQFRQAAKLLKVRDTELWNYPDIYEKRLPVSQIAQRLANLPKPAAVFTHGIIGEYGHPHHQDVCAAVFQAFPEKKITCVAYNCYPSFTVQISPKNYRIKTKVLAEIYQEETRRFSNFLPAHATESFVKLKKREVDAIYHFFLEGSEPHKNALQAYKWYWPYLLAQKAKSLPRPF